MRRRHGHCQCTQNRAGLGSIAGQLAFIVGAASSVWLGPSGAQFCFLDALYYAAVHGRRFSDLDRGRADSGYGGNRIRRGIRARRSVGLDPRVAPEKYAQAGTDGQVKETMRAREDIWPLGLKKGGVRKEAAYVICDLVKGCHHRKVSSLWFLLSIFSKSTVAIRCGAKPWRLLRPRKRASKNSLCHLPAST